MEKVTSDNKQSELNIGSYFEKQYYNNEQYSKQTEKKSEQKQYNKKSAGEIYENHIKDIKTNLWQRGI